MIATVEVPDEPHPLVFTLGDDQKWRCDAAPEAAEALNALQRDSWRPWNGQPGAWQARRAAGLLGGRVTHLSGPHPEPAGTAY